MNKYIELINKPEYDFLKTNEHLGDNIIFLGLGGSYAYGTNVPTSDLDIRGVALEKPENIIGYQNFEQVLDNPTDTTVYAFNKFIHLLTDANPNILEMIGLDADQYLYMTPLGRELIANKDLFLSQRVFYTFGGYAQAQLKRLENALARDNYPEERKNEHIAQALKNSIIEFNSHHENEVNPSFAKVIDGKLLYNLHLENFPCEDLENLYSTISCTIRNYRELNNRNRKKDDAHLCKHAMHLVRLLVMGAEILRWGVIKTHRVGDHNMLMAIRNGEFMGTDGNMTSDFYKMVAELEKDMEIALSESVLPKKPNISKIEEFVMEVNKNIIDGKYKDQKFTLCS